MDKSGKRNGFGCAGRQKCTGRTRKVSGNSIERYGADTGGCDRRSVGTLCICKRTLERKFTSQEKDAYTVKANACGREWAKRISEKYGTEDPKILAGKMGMKVKMPKFRPEEGWFCLHSMYSQMRSQSLQTA